MSPQLEAVAPRNQSPSPSPAQTTREPQVQRARVNAGESVASLTGRTPYDPAITNKLDALIDAGQLFLENSGPRLKERLIRRGSDFDSPELRERQLKNHADACAAIDGMIKAAARSQVPPAKEIATIVMRFLSSLMADTNCVLEVARQAEHYAVRAEHCLQMSLFGMALGIEMGMSDQDVRHIGLSGLLHDWGMAMISPEILEADRVLTKSEFLEIKRHPVHTLKFLKTVPGIPDLVPLICYQVHERPNGTGYPQGLKRLAIHPCARILHVADVYLALTSARPFRKALMPYVAVECLLLQATGGLVDVDIVRGLLHVVSLFPVGSKVKMSDGSVARVVRRNGNNYSSPIVQIIQDSSGEPIADLNGSSIIDTSARNLTISGAIPESDVEQTTVSLNDVQLQRS